MNEFRINHSPSSRNHPDYVFGKVGNKFKSFGLNHSPKAEHPHKELDVNPNSNDKEKSYLQTTVKTTHQKFFGKPLSGWNFDRYDKAYVKHRVKKYRKKHK